MSHFLLLVIPQSSLVVDCRNLHFAKNYVFSFFTLKKMIFSLSKIPVRAPTNNYQTDNWLIIKLLLFHLFSSMFCVTLEPRFGNVSQSLSISRALVSLTLSIILIGDIFHDMKFSLVQIILLAERGLPTLCGLHRSIPWLLFFISFLHHPQPPTKKNFFMVTRTRPVLWLPLLLHLIFTSSLWP